jgi:hypothetical protein
MSLSKCLNSTRSLGYCVVWSLLLCASLHAQAESGRADYDLDDDGLIEIDDLADLNEIRNNLDGTSLYGVSTGCPVSGCNGFELTADLDFDTNGDGVMDANDNYWNDGAGWEPIGLGVASFTGILDGNYHRISNLYINRSVTERVGLFSMASGATLRNLRIDGPLMRINALKNVGALVGRNTGSASDTLTISNCWVAGEIIAQQWVGGLVGFSSQALVLSRVSVSGSVTATIIYGAYAGGLVGQGTSHLTVQDSYVAAAVINDSGSYVGGLAGYITKDVTITRSYVSGPVSGGSSVGALIGYKGGIATVTEGYYDKNTTGQSGSADGQALGYTTTQLQNPTSNTGIYANWPLGNWNFGTSSQYPVPVIDGAIYLDSDNDGVLDFDVAFPNDPTETVDSDNDGVGNNADAFPGDPNEWTDSDNDLVGDNSDAFPNDPTEWADSDSDLVGDNADAFPDDPTETEDNDNDGIGNNADTDDDNDGIPDEYDDLPFIPSDSVDSDGDGVGDSTDVDLDGDGLIEIDTLAKLSNIRNNLAGSAYNDGNGDDSSGCGDGDTITACNGYELTADLDFDTNGDGVMDANDSYWNDGAGWEPIGLGATPFTGILDGNNHRISNLYIDRSSAERVGLFSMTSGATLRNLRIDGPLMFINALKNVGALVGRNTGNASYTLTISNCWVAGEIIAQQWVGGLVGYSSQPLALTRISVSGSITATIIYTAYAGGLVGQGNNHFTVQDSYVAAAVINESGSYVGGLAGYISKNVNITRSYVSGSVSGGSSVGALIGYKGGTATVTEGYYDKSTTGQSGSADGQALGYTTTQLQNPTSNTGIYANWPADTWDVGTSSQYPVLIIDGLTYRDSDDDGAWDSEDAFPNDPSESTDSDDDGIGDNADPDDDNDNVADADDVFPFDATESADNDHDGIGDNADPDDDNDNVADADDAFPFDATESADNDHDGIGDNADTDDDNDNVVDTADAFPFDATESADFDHDGIGDNADTDDDNDNVADADDAFPFDATESADFDHDGIGDNADTDDDNDNVADADDAFPFDATESADFDHDGTGDNADTDDDNDNVDDADDAFPFDATESADNDQDGIGDNADTDDDNDNVADTADAFPFDATESADNDHDGIGDNADPDDDNDNVADTADAFPFDATESADFDQDGIGDNADSDDDNDHISDAYELQYGLNPYDDSDAAGDLDGDGRTNLDEYLEGSNPTTDNAAPVLTVPADLQVNSTGATTSVDLGVATAVDGKDGTITPEADMTGPFAPGHYTITWSATDEAGNTATATQNLDVIPQVSTTITQTVEEGSQVTVSVSLNGSPVSYPVTVPYTVSGTASYPSDHDLEAGSIEIASGLSGSVTFNTLADGVFEGTESVVVTLGTPTNAILGASQEHIIFLTEVNVAPSVSLRFMQGDEQVSSVYADRGLVTVEAVVVDPNVNDSLMTDWSQTDSQISPGSGWQDTRYSVDPSNLQGTYGVAVTVTDGGNESASASTTLRIVSTSPNLSSAQDTDGDGASDADEGVADANGNRIVDYLDPVSGSDLLPTTGAGPTMQVQTGQSLALGDIAYGLGLVTSELTLDDIANYTGETLAKESGLQFLSGIFDFEVHGLAQGGTTQLVIPLSAAIPRDAQYVKYFKGLGWINFTEDGANSLASAPGTLGVCPGPGSSDYTSGLSEGNFCVQLSIVDGGPNDEDGLANGVIKDPSAVATSFIAEPIVSVSNSGLSSTSFSAGDGEKIVLSFSITSDSTDAELTDLTLQASGDLDEVNDIGPVKIYRDANSNGIAEASELVSSGHYSADDGTLSLTLDTAYTLPAGATNLLVSYDF